MQAVASPIASLVAGSGICSRGCGQVVHVCVAELKYCEELHAVVTSDTNDASVTSAVTCKVVCPVHAPRRQKSNPKSNKLDGHAIPPLRPLASSPQPSATAASPLLPARPRGTAPRPSRQLLVWRFRISSLGLNSELPKIQPKVWQKRPSDTTPPLSPLFNEGLFCESALTLTNSVL